MKKISIYFLLGFSILSFSLKAQWTEFNTGISSPTDICFVDSLNGFIIELGNVYKTIDGGENWSIIASDLNDAQYIAALSQDTIVVGGDSLKATYDGGQFWNSISSYEVNNAFETYETSIADIAFIGDYLYGMFPYVMMCDESTILDVHYLARSNDFGTTWELIESEISAPLKIYRINKDIGAAFGRSMEYMWNCEYIYGTTSCIVQNNEYNLSSGGYFEYITGCLLPNSSEQIIGKMLSYDNNSLLADGQYFENEIFNETSDIVYFKNNSGFLVKDSNIYKTEDIGENWEISLTTPSKVIHSTLFGTHKVLLLCNTGEIFIYDYAEEIPDYELLCNRQEIVYPQTIYTDTETTNITLINTGKKGITLSMTCQNPFSIKPNEENSYTNLLEDIYLSKGEEIILNVKFHPENVGDFIDTLRISMAEDLNQITNIPIIGECIDFQGVLINDTVLCADTIFIEENWRSLPGSIVEICPGTIILFKDAYKKIDIRGSLIANGEFDNKIIVGSDLSNNANGYFDINNTPQDSIILKNCLFEEYTELTSQGLYNLALDNCEFGINSSMNIYGGTIITINNCAFKKDTKLENSSNIFIENCLFDGENITHSEGITLFSVTNLTIKNSIFRNLDLESIGVFNSENISVVDNDIYSCDDMGIRFYNSNGIIKNNIIYNNYPPLSQEGAITITNAEAVQIFNNLIFNNGSTLGIGGIYIDGYAELINNTICSNANNGIKWENANGLMYNNIIHNNGALVLGDELNIGYNLSPEYLPGEYNVIGDPVFENPSTEVGIITNPVELDWRIQNNSPCLDAGNNDVAENLAFDLYGNPRIMDGNNDGSAIIDMGVYEMEGESSGIYKTENPIAQIFPNPSSGQIQIHLNENKTQPLELKIYEISGSLVWEGIISDKQSSINLESLKAGVYLLKLIEEDHSQREILILQ